MYKGADRSQPAWCPRHSTHRAVIFLVVLDEGARKSVGGEGGE